MLKGDGVEDERVAINVLIINKQWGQIEEYKSKKIYPPFYQFTNCIKFALSNTKVMTEEVEMVKGEFQEANAKSISHLDNELIKLRVGKAMPNMLHGVMIDYYGSQTPITQVANIASMDARTLTVQPWEKAMLGDIAKGIINANLGFAPQDNGEMLIINVPPLTEERRRDLVKKAKAEGEHAKVAVRNNRKDAMDFIKGLKNDGLSEDLAKDAESEIQDITNTFVAKIDSLIEQKEKDIMTI